jgi:O-antigen ligase
MILLLSSRNERFGMVRIFVLFSSFIMFLLLLLATISTSSENYLTTYVERFTSVFTSETYVESSTVGARMNEIKAAWESIATHPWMGIGIGAIYDYVAVWNPQFDSHEWKGVTYIHNVYILVLTKLGLLGLIPLLAMLVVYFVRARRIYQTFPEGVDRALVMGGIGATLSCVVASNLQPDLASPGTVSILGVIWGGTEFLRWWHDGGSNLASGRERHSSVSEQGNL